MVNIRAIDNLADQFRQRITPHDWDPGYGWYDETTPEVIAALGDDESDAVNFIANATEEQRFFLGFYVDDIAEVFRSPAMINALAELTDFPDEFKADYLPTID